MLKPCESGMKVIIEPCNLPLPDQNQIENNEINAICLVKKRKPWKATILDGMTPHSPYQICIIRIINCLLHILTCILFVSSLENR